MFTCLLIILLFHLLHVEPKLFVQFPKARLGYLHLPRALVVPGIFCDNPGPCIDSFPK